LFGANSNNSLSSNTLTLDVSNPSALSFKEAVVSPTPVTANSSNNNGAVIGGAVGGALGVSLK
jgi:outer membrane lipoprotein SlyB